MSYKMIQSIINYFKKPKFPRTLTKEDIERILKEDEQKQQALAKKKTEKSFIKQRYYCDVCQEPAFHVAYVTSDTGKHAIGAKCDNCLPSVFNVKIEPGQNVHFVGFKEKPITSWFECGCPEKVSHYILKE